MQRKDNIQHHEYWIYHPVVTLYINSAACFNFISCRKKYGNTIVLFVRKQLRDTMSLAAGSRFRVDLSVHDSFISVLN